MIGMPDEFAKLGGELWGGLGGVMLGTEAEIGGSEIETVKTG